jgi:hypothetical protein
MKPGIANCPARSITWVEVPTYFAISAFDPTAMILPPRVASACPSGNLSSTVTIRPLRRTRSAGGICCAIDAAPCAGIARSAARVAKTIDKEKISASDFMDKRETPGELSIANFRYSNAILLCLPPNEAENMIACIK